MPDCHRCPLDGEGSAACLKCTGPAEGPNNHGQTHVSVDQVAGFIPAPEPADHGDSRYDAALAFVRMFAGFGLIEREIVAARMRGEQYPSITARLNLMLAKPVTLQAIHSRAKKAVQKHPMLAVLFADMVEKQKKRKQRTKGDPHA
jgi:hypothetical protein